MPRTRILTRDARTTTGSFFLDEEVLREAGVDRLRASTP